MDIFNLLFGTLGREWCIVFRVMVIITGISFFAVAFYYVWDILRGKSKLYDGSKLMILVTSFYAYITSRLYLTMCVR